jgi:hypothetical protein
MSEKIKILPRPIRPRPLVPRFVYVRDRIEVNQDFRKEVQDEIDHRIADGSLKVGTPLYFLAREIIHAPNFTFALHGFPLIFAADLYDGKGGGITTTGPNGDNGAKGDPGTPGKAEWDATKSKPGGPGTDGGNGKNGTAANSITLLAQEVRNLKLTATGSAGGAGGTGGTGGKGGDGTVKPKPSQVPGSHDRRNPTRGGNGGNGGSGGAGGDGAPIIAHVVKKTRPGTPITVTGLTLNASGGPGGARGTGGTGGKGGVWLQGDEPGAVAGKTGALGQPGASGKAGTITHTTPKLADWWKLVVSLVPASSWADYRVRVGDYLFRSYSPDSPPKKDNRKHARDEFESALHLSPSNARAKHLLGYLDTGLTPVGVGYQHDLRPEFEQYEEFLTSYSSEKNHLFEITLDILFHAKETGKKVQEVKVHGKHAEGMLASVETDLVIAESEQEQADAQLGFANEQLKAAGKKVAEIQKERLNQSMSVGDIITTVGAVIGAVASIVAAVYTFGTSLSATVACVGVLVNEAGKLNDLTDIVDLSDPASPKLTPKGELLVGKLSDLIKKTKDFVDKADALAELVDKPEDDELARKEKELIRQQFEAAFQVNMRGLDVEQAKLAVLSVKQKRDTFKADVEALGNLTDGWEHDMRELARIARMLLRQFQAYVDFFIEYGFLRARAFDLYTLPTKLEAPSFRFDYGYVEPDLEEDAFFALERGDDKRVTGLLGQYVNSLSSFKPAELRVLYDKYDENLSTENWNWTITTPSVISNLKNIGTASFSTAMNDLPPYPTELKIVRAEVALIGATTDGDPWVNVWLEHGGDATNRRSNPDKTEVVVHAPRRGESVPARREPIDLQQLSEVQMQRFWGRSPITTWRVTILPEAAQNAGLDLSNLTKVELAVRYKYVNPR